MPFDRGCWDIFYTLDPLDNGSVSSDSGGLGDPDDDGLSNVEELEYGGSPIVSDTDGDGILLGVFAVDIYEYFSEADSQ